MRFEWSLHCCVERAALSLLLGLFLLVPAAARAQYAGPAPARGDVTPQLTIRENDEARLEALMNAPQPVVRIAPGDMLAVKIYNVKNYDLHVRVDAKGAATFPLIGDLQVAGLSGIDLENLIRTRLQQGGMIRDPHVNVLLSEVPTQTVTISGEVGKPGNFPVYGHHTLIEMISAAGGLKDTASHTVVLNRPGIGESIPIQLGPDPTHSRFSSIPLFAGDTVIASKVGVFYIVGAVKTSGAYPLKDTTPITVVDAIALAGGAGFEASEGNVRVVRRVDGVQRTEIKLNLNKVIKGKENDPVLEADDIVLVPTSKMKAAIKGGGAGLAVSLAASFMIYH